MSVQTFEEYCDSSLYILKYHVADGMRGDIKTLERSVFWTTARTIISIFSTTRSIKELPKDEE